MPAILSFVTHLVGSPAGSQPSRRVAETSVCGGYARPLRITVISELLGIPVTDREWIWVTVTDYGQGGEELQRVPPLGEGRFLLLSA